jgi:hypothetical protein
VHRSSKWRWRRPDDEKGPLTWENGACQSGRAPQSSHTLDQLDAIAGAGLLLPATLAERLGIE